MAVKVLKFGASWCNACVQADRFLDRTEDTRTIQIDKIDVEENEELAIKYGIKNLPTFIAVKPNGDIVGKFIGFDKTKLEAFLKELKYK